MACVLRSDGQTTAVHRYLLRPFGINNGEVNYSRSDGLSASSPVSFFYSHIICLPHFILIIPFAIWNENIRHSSMKRASELKRESSVEVEVEVVLPYWSGVYPYRNLCIAFSSYLINLLI